MASITAILSFLLIACAVFAQMVPMDQGCSASSTNSLITLTYTPWMAPQIGPTSTVYQAFVTTYYNIVFCGRGTPTATVTNVQDNPTPIGPFTTKTTVSVCTVTAVGCMPSDAVVTRREVRGLEYVKRDDATKPKYPQLKPLYEGRGPSGILIPTGWKPGHSIQDLEAATHQNAKRQAVPTTLSPEAAALVEQLQTAQYALDICDSPFNLTEVCQDLRKPAAIVPLSNVGVIASQASDIVCFASVYGIDLNTTNAALLGDLAAAVYGLEIGDNFTTTTNTTKLCNNINLTAAPYLGIDASAVNNFICGGPSTTVTATAVATQTVVIIPGSPTVTFTAVGIGAAASTLPSAISTSSFTISPSGVGTSRGLPFPSGLGTGPNGWPNGTLPLVTAGGSVVPGGTAASGVPAATGANKPWGNSTGIDSLGIDFSPASNEPLGSTPNTPKAPHSPQYYPVNTLRTTLTAAAWGGYA